MMSPLPWVIKSEFNRLNPYFIGDPFSFGHGDQVYEYRSITTAVLHQMALSCGEHDIAETIYSMSCTQQALYEAESIAFDAIHVSDIEVWYSFAIGAYRSRMLADRKYMRYVRDTATLTGHGSDPKRPIHMDFRLSKLWTETNIIGRVLMELRAELQNRGA